MKKFKWLKYVVFMVLIAGPAWGAASDYKVKSDGTIYGYDFITKGPWIDSRAYTTLEANNTAAYNAEKLLVISQNHTLTASTTLTAAVKVLKGGSFSSNELMTLDVAATPADFAAGATITGATSNATCVVISKLTSTTYRVKNRSGAFTLGEVLSDGANSADQGAAKPTFTDAYTLTINGPFEGCNGCFVGFTTGVTFGAGVVKEVMSEWWGAKPDSNGTGTSGTDNIVAMTAATTTCGRTHTLKLNDGIYRISSVLAAVCPIKGNSPATSIIYNSGTGDGLYLAHIGAVYTGYFTTYKDFSVSGNASSRDGITLYTTTGDNVAYCNFNSVYSYNNGRHGLYHRCAWATRYSDCKFYSNAGLGIYLAGTVGDPGVANGVSFLGCESRGNGGTATETTFADDKGGVKITGAQAVIFIGGVYEGNNAWTFIVAGTDNANRSITIEGIEAEASPNGATTGGFLYVTGIWQVITVKNSWLAHGADTGKTSYVFYIVRIEAFYQAPQIFTEENNFILSIGPGSAIKWYGFIPSPAQAMAKTNLINAVYGVVTPANVKGFWIFDQNGAVSTITDRATIGGASAHTITLRDRTTGGAVNAQMVALGADFAGLAPYINFNGSYVFDTPDSSDFSFTSGGGVDTAFSIVILAQINTTSVLQRLLAKLNDTGAQGEWSFEIDESGILGGDCWIPDRNANITRIYNSSLSGSIGLWRTYAMTYSASKTNAGIKLYLNGTRVDDTDGGSGTYTGMVNGTALVGNYQSARLYPGNAMYSMILVVAEELTAIQVARLDALARGYTGVNY